MNVHASRVVDEGVRIDRGDHFFDTVEVRQHGSQVRTAEVFHRSLAHPAGDDCPAIQYG